MCFGWYVLSLSVRKRIFLKTEKADQKQCENWRHASGSEFHKTSPTSERGEWRKQLQHFLTQSLKQTPLGSCAISRLFWPDGIKFVQGYSVYIIIVNTRQWGPHQWICCKPWDKANEVWLGSPLFAWQLESPATDCRPFIPLFELICRLLYKLMLMHTCSIPISTNAAACWRS